jgi:glycopeptide antibiotics resistance protein
MKHKWIKQVLFVVYCIFIVWYTIFNRSINEVRFIDLRFMWSYREMLAGDLNWEKDVLQNLLNIVFFVPYGALFPVKKWKFVLVTAFIFSILIEAFQYIFKLGYCELDDVICNSLGAMIGFGISIVLMKVVKKRNDA